MKRYDAIIPLGGGRNKDGSLTEMSLERLDKGIELYEIGIGPKIVSHGGKKSTYRPNAIKFDQLRGEIVAQYLISKGVPAGNIILSQPEAVDTIGEALVLRELAKEHDFNKLMIVTSELHVPRALYIFRRILGKEIQIHADSVPSNGLLIEEEEKEYLSLVTLYFDKLPEKIEETSFEMWFRNHTDLYADYLMIHDKYHANGRESQAYLAVSK